MDAGNRIQFTPLSGAHSEKPLSYLLEIDDFKILLDCGWNDKLDLADIQPIVEYVPRAKPYSPLPLSLFVST